MHRKSAYILFLAVLALLVIGIVMLFSTSAFARDSHGDVYFFIKRQAMWFGVGLVVCIFAALIDYHLWQRTWWLWLALALVVLALCYVPHIGMRLNGSRRWIGWGPITVQPSELAKVTVIFFLAAWFSRYEKTDRKLLLGFILPLAIISLPAALVLGEVALGTTALIAWGSGGMEGLGLGNGRQKMLYLPYAHTDFIFPIVGEELGLRFSLLVVFLFVVIIVCGTMIALHA